jgi:hypothetical protein
LEGVLKIEGVALRLGKGLVLLGLLGAASVLTASGKLCFDLLLTNVFAGDLAVNG